MKKSKNASARICAALLGVLLLCVPAMQLTGCTVSAQATDLTEDIQRGTAYASSLTDSENAAAVDFAVRLFQNTVRDGETLLLSPFSVLCALGMTANGAQGETLSQTEAVLGMKKEALNSYLLGWQTHLSQGGRTQLHLANSVWLTADSRPTVNKSFLQTNADYYGAGIYKAPFHDAICKSINAWVREKTNGMIPKIIDAIPDSAAMYLVNALAFEAAWQEPYQKEQIADGIFIKEDGTEQSAAFLHSTEHVYLEDESAVGFAKYYQGRQYAFVALLPNEGVSLAEYIASLRGDSLHALLKQENYAEVAAALPKFETQSAPELSAVLRKMGMQNAFCEAADFGALGHSDAGNIAIGRVLHKTFLSVAEQGTKAGTASAVEMLDRAAPSPEEPKCVVLERPFVYLLLDCKTAVPLFIGTMTDLSQ